MFTHKKFSISFRFQNAKEGKKREHEASCDYDRAERDNFGKRNEHVVFQKKPQV
jgi:hypothetical protein